MMTKTAEENVTAKPAESRWSGLAKPIGELCVRVPVAAGAAGLARELAASVPQLAFREVLSRGGWYRLGGVVDAKGNRVSSELEDWAATELRKHDDDFLALADSYAESGLKATRLTGKTHYWTAKTGGAAADFIQLEIEELQEVVCRPSIFDDEAPASLEELIDPRLASGIAPVPIGIPVYRLRRVTDVAEFLARMRAQKPDPQPVHRFFDAWDNSSAGGVTQLSKHWVVGTSEHLDCYRQPILQATPVATANGAPPRFDGAYGARGLALRDALHRFDRQAGHSMAWFFHMLTTKAVPHAVAAAVVEDMQSGFGYLPERDLQIVKNWLHRPYGL
jgi:hypothetical protein